MGDPLDPELGPLADNGGPTFTHQLLVGSPATDAGSNPNNYRNDQRGPGFDREVPLGFPDIGAVEPQCTVDTDNDGICNAPIFDNCPDDPNPDQLDTDGDGLGDVCDPCPLDRFNDADDDGVCVDLDNCPFKANPGPDPMNPEANQLDSDGDGMGDPCDTCPTDPTNTCGVCVDADSDTICDNVDNCLNLANSLQTDADGDGIGDACDVCPTDASNMCNDEASQDDVDGDGVLNTADNCPGLANTNQNDIDNDGKGDVCDLCPYDSDTAPGGSDPDGDGVCTFNDNCPDVKNPLQEDTDQDGEGDACDTCTDTDDDGAGNPGFNYSTCELQQIDNCPSIFNPSQEDFDGDDLGDRCDTIPGGATIIPGDKLPLPPPVLLPMPAPIGLDGGLGVAEAPRVDAVVPGADIAPSPEVVVNEAKHRNKFAKGNGEVEAGGCSNTGSSSTSTMVLFLAMLLMLRFRPNRRRNE